LVPESVQDAVNKYTRVNNKVRRLKDFFG
jgi:hypothetical protein